MFSIFKNKENSAEENQTLVLKAYLPGKVIPIEEVKDEVFSSKALGDGLAIEPEGNIVTAPCAATVSLLMDDSKHAVGLTLSNGAELLIHEGIDTVNMQGDGFSAQCKRSVIGTVCSNLYRNGIITDATDLAI